MFRVLANTLHWMLSYTIYLHSNPVYVGTRNPFGDETTKVQSNGVKFLKILYLDIYIYITLCDYYIVYNIYSYINYHYNVNIEYIYILYITYIL